jgi:hypothetical protein
VRGRPVAAPAVVRGRPPRRPRPRPRPPPPLPPFGLAVGAGTHAKAADAMACAVVVMMSFFSVCWGMLATESGVSPLILSDLRTSTLRSRETSRAVMFSLRAVSSAPSVKRALMSPRVPNR